MGLKNQKLGYDEVEHRDLKFNLTLENVSRYWFNNEPWTTHFMNSILAAVPDGERWVMRSASKQLKKLTHGEVRESAIEFIRQERTHAREHDQMNALITEQGVPMDKIEGVFKYIRKNLQHRLSEDMQSSIAAAFEHFTAILSEVFLENPELFKDTDPLLRAMLYWHFIEETEHKSVSFDVFTDSTGAGFESYIKRVQGMLLATAVGLPILLGNYSYLLIKDRQLLNLVSAARSINTLWLSPGPMKKVLLEGYAPYFFPSFHPWEADNRETIQVWKTAYKKYNGDTEKAFEAFQEWSHTKKKNRKHGKSYLKLVRN